MTRTQLVSRPRTTTVARAALAACRGGFTATERSSTNPSSGSSPDGSTSGGSGGKTSGGSVLDNANT